MDSGGKIKKSGIRWGLFRAFIIFAAAILILLWLCQVVFFDSIYKAIKVAEIKSFTSEISAKIDDNDALGEFCREGAEKDSVCVLVLKMLNGKTGVKRVSVHTQNECAIHSSNNASKFILYESTVDSGGTLLQYLRYNLDDRSFYDSSSVPEGAAVTDESIVYSVVIKDEEGYDNFIVVSSVIYPVEATRNTLLWMLVAITILTLITAGVMAIIFAGKISRPIRELSKGARELAKRNYDVHFTEKGYKEIVELGSTLNYATGELSKVDELCRELIANISHDLRTPLTMIKGYSEVMRDIPGENTPENVQIIIDEANRLTSLVNDVLDVSRFRQGLMKFEKEEFSITDEVEAAVERYNKLMEREGYVFSFVNIGGEKVNVMSDKIRILQVLYNLLNNAITYTGEDKKITVEQTVNEGLVRITVIDTGEGIPADQLELIWDRYYRVKEVHKRAHIGTGLGLSIVKQVISVAGGRCGVDSALGFGSKFWFELPIILNYSTNILTNQ